MKIVNIGLLIALTFPFAVTAFPGNGGKFEKYRARRIDNLSKELNLTAEQKSQIETVFKEEHTKYRAIHEETRSKMQQILTPEQMTKMKEMHQGHYGKKHKMHEKRMQIEDKK